MGSAASRSTAAAGEVCFKCHYRACFEGADSEGVCALEQGAKQKKSGT